MNASEETDHGFKIRISDIGIGMNKEEISFALKPFGKVQNTAAADSEETDRASRCWCP